MLFNSLQYMIFLPIVVIIYFLLPNKYRNLFLLFASYYFYAGWIPKYLVLIIGTTVITYFTAILIDKSKNISTRKKFLAIGIIINLIVLFVFKYSNFFIENINQLFKFLSLNFQLNNEFSIMLPVGISFYTFQSIAYCIDVYRNDVKCEKNYITYALFVSFFPQLVAGPIERSNNLIKQFYHKHKFNYSDAVFGMRYILLGMFRKVVISDLLAVFVNAIYNNLSNYSGLSLIIATLMFAIQIYCDFSGYSIIALGSAKILGFNLMENFKSPYFSTSITEFWSRWHISLSTWFKDYVYIPLGGNRKGFRRKLINLTIIFLISGLWHGASWTFVIWGLLHALYRVIEELYKHCVEPFKFKYRFLYKYHKVLKGVFTFLFVCIAWIFFRANNINDALYVLKNLFNNFNIPFAKNAFDLIIQSEFFYSNILNYTLYTILLFSVGRLFIEDFVIYSKNLNASTFYEKMKFYRYIDYFILTILIILVFAFLNSVYGQTGQFIYFQF